MVDLRHLPALVNWSGKPAKVYAVRKGQARIRVLTTATYYTVPVESLFPQGRLDCRLTVQDINDCVPSPFLRSAVQKLPSETKGEPMQGVLGRPAGDLAQPGEEMPRCPEMARGAA